MGEEGGKRAADLQWVLEHVHHCGVDRESWDSFDIPEDVAATADYLLICLPDGSGYTLLVNPRSPTGHWSTIVEMATGRIEARDRGDAEHWETVEGISFVAGSVVTVANPWGPNDGPSNG